MDVRLAADLGLTPNIAIAVEVPLRLFATTIRYEDLTGHQVEIANDDVHHRDETLFGPGDPLIGARFAFAAGDWSFGANVGLRVPLGHIEPNPYTPAARVEPHEHFQFGTGTVDPELGLSARYDFGALALSGWVWTHLSLYENQYGFQAGNRYAGGLDASSSFGLAAWRFAAMLDANAESSERWSGLPPVDDGNQGRFDLYAGLGATWRPSDSFFAALNARVPLYHHIVGGQLELPVVLELTIGGSFSLWSDAPVAAPEQRPDRTPGDVVEVTTAAPVSGRLTVVDYWAQWCAPCKVLDALLRDIASEHRLLSVRRYDVGDEAPAGMSLPYVEVYDPQDVLIYRGAGDPQAIANDIEAITDGGRPASRLPR